jgi:hypothetical protein
VSPRTRFLRHALGAAWIIAACGCATRESAHDGAGGPDAGRVSVTEAAPDTGADPMIVSLVEAFTARRAAARQVSIVEYRREGAGGGANLVLARGARPDAAFAGNPADDLFGVFVFDDSLQRIRSTVTIFPAPRAGETHMRFDRTTADSVYLFGWAATSGETLLTEGFRWRGGPPR